LSATYQTTHRVGTPHNIRDSSARVQPWNKSEQFITIAIVDNSIFYATNH